MKLDKIEQVYKCLETIEHMGNKRSDKIDLLQKHRMNSFLITMFKMAYHPGLTFGIRIDHQITEMPFVHYGKLKAFRRFTEFESLAYDLFNRRLIGNKARDEVFKFLSQCSNIEVKWLSRVINKDLRIGISSKTIKQIWPKLIPMLSFAKGETFDESKHKLDFPVAVEPKFDGFRMFIVAPKLGSTYAINPGQVDYTDKLKHIIKPIEKLKRGFIYDGEIIATWDECDDHKRYKSQWGKTSTLLTTGMKNQIYDPDSVTEELKSEVENNLIFMVFDIIKHKPYILNGHYKVPWYKRQQILKSHYLQITKHKSYNNQIIIVPSSKCRKMDDVVEAYSKSVQNGYEGVMIKDRKAYYYGKRSKSMLKIKMVNTEDYTILKCIEGKGKYEKKLGAFEFKNKEGDIVRVGSGFSDKQRSHFWKIRKIIESGNCYAEVAFQVDPRKVANNRFPVFKRLRLPGEKS